MKKVMPIMKNEYPDKIAQVFSIFHDGTICGCTGDLTKLTLKVECLYLAELINPDFDSLYVVLSDISGLYFTAWSADEKSYERISVVQEIFEPELEIISTEIVEDIVIIHCRQDNAKLGKGGGELHLSCGSIKVLDQAGEEITIDYLSRLCKQYWDNLR